MSRRHAFRPDALDTLEGRLAPGAFLIGGHATLAHPAAVHPAKAVAKPQAKSSSINIDWHKLGTQVTDFLGITHKAKPHVAAKPAATGRLLRG